MTDRSGGVLSNFSLTYYYDRTFITSSNKMTMPYRITYEEILFKSRYVTTYLTAAFEIVNSDITGLSGNYNRKFWQTCLVGTNTVDPG